jgi:hypothetical protein
MARCTNTYAIRRAVEGGGQVKAELISVGQSGEQSLKRIETAGGRASGGLRDLGRRAELLRSGIRTLGGALIGAATVGGLGALIDRSISAADAIGKTVDKIGVGVEALQKLRFVPTSAVPVTGSRSPGCSVRSPSLVLLEAARLDAEGGMMGPHSETGATRCQRSLKATLSKKANALTTLPSAMSRNQA